MNTLVIRSATKSHRPSAGVDDLEVATRIEAFLRAHLRGRVDDSRFSREINLWEQGYVDSIGVVELIAYIEATFDVAVPDEALFDPDFTSVDGIARIVRALLAHKTA